MNTITNKPLIHFPIESEYYIYFSDRQHSHTAGIHNDLVDKGWIVHPELSVGFRYSTWGSWNYEFTLEVYVQPLYKSGFVPLGKHLLEKKESCLNYILSRMVNRHNIDHQYHVLFKRKPEYKYVYYYLRIFFNQIHDSKAPTGSDWNRRFSSEISNLFDTGSWRVSEYDRSSFFECQDDNKPFIFPLRLDESK